MNPAQSERAEYHSRENFTKHRGQIKPLKEFADIGDPERPLETSANFSQAF